MGSPELMRVFIEATAIGDALGATTEFLSFADAAEGVVRGREQGYPWRPIGGGWLNLKAGECTDDTAMSVLLADALDDMVTLDVRRLASLFAQWVKTGPPDVGGTIRAVVAAQGFTTDPLAVSAAYFRRYPDRCGNGALMRNAVCAAAAPDLAHAFRWSLLQGAVTHYHPLWVLCCAMQIWLMWETFEERWPFGWHDDWVEAWHAAWTSWVSNEADEDVKAWLAEVQKDDSLNNAMRAVCDAEFGADEFDPFSIDLGPIQGWALVGLQIAVWAMQWCQRSASQYPFAVPAGLTVCADVFAQRRHRVVGWLPLLGHDADTYGAIAGPMIACGMGKPFGKQFLNHVQVPSLGTLVGADEAFRD